MLRPILLLLLAAATLTAQETLIRETFDPKTDTHVEVVALFTSPAPGGYLPVRVKIANNLNSERSIRLAFEARGSYYNPGLNTRSSFDFTAAAGKTVTRDIFVPTAPSVGPASTCSISTTLSGSLGTAFNTIESGLGSNQPAVLLSEALFTPNASILDSHTSGHFSHSYRGTSDFAGKFDPTQIPDDWRAYAAYDSLLMTDADWANVPAGARNAILSWVRLGGQLAIFSQTGATQQSLGLPTDPSFGQITIAPINFSNTLDPAKTLDLVTNRKTDPRQQSLRSDFDGMWPLQNTFGTRSFQYGLFILVLIAFGILVGPVNLFVFAKSGRRHRLFITTPLISLGASLVLVGLIILQDGIGGSGARTVLMEVRPDGGQNAAFVHQEQFCRTGVLTGTRFTINTPCVINPVPINQSRWARLTNRHDAAGNFVLQPDGGKLSGSGDWFQSRSEHGHFLTAVVPTRGRIEPTSNPGTLISTFEFPLEAFYHLDSAGQWHSAKNIQPGKPFTLTPIDRKTAEAAIKSTAFELSQRLRIQFAQVNQRPGHYFAITTQAPAIETLPGIRWKTTTTLITGPVM